MENNHCIANLLRFICLLQNNSTNSCLNEGCSKDFLGPSISLECYNTRVISLYRKDGALFSVNYTNSSTNTLESSLFRIMSVDDETVTLLILSRDGNNYLSTDQYITLNLNCICAVRCLDDVSINL